MGSWDSLGEGWSHEVNESLVRGIEIITIFRRSQGKFLDNAVGEKGGMEMWEFGRNFSEHRGAASAHLGRIILGTSGNFQTGEEGEVKQGGACGKWSDRGDLVVVSAWWTVIVRPSDLSQGAGSTAKGMF